MGVRFGEKEFGKSFFVSFVQFKKEIESMGFEISETNIVDIDLMEMKTNMGTIIKFVPIEIMNPKLSEGVRIFVDNIKSKNSGTLPQFQYLDFRYGNKIFYK